MIELCRKPAFHSLRRLTLVVTVMVFTLGSGARAQIPVPGPIPLLPGQLGPSFPGISGPELPIGQSGSSTVTVVDPAHIFETIANGRNILEQIENQAQQIEHEVRMLKKLADPPWREIEGHMVEMEGLMRQGEAVAYSMSDLSRLLAETFPGAAPYVEWVEEYVEQVGRSIDTQENVLMSLRRHGQQFTSSHQQLRQIKHQMQTVEGQTGALEVGNTLSAFTAEELILMRQMLAAQTNALVVYHTYQMNREAQIMATRREIYESKPVPLPGKTFTGGSRDIFK